MINPDNCGFADGVPHQHTEVCHQAGITIGRKQGRAEAVAFLYAQADIHRDGPSAAKIRAALHHAADRLRDGHGTGKPTDLTPTTDGLVEEVLTDA